MSKTSQLNTLATLAQNDLIQVVDVSDTVTMTGGGGTNKKITIQTLANSLKTDGGLQENIEMGTPGQYYAGDKTWKTLNKAAVGLSNVTNESKTKMFENPEFTGIVTLPSTTSIGVVSSTELNYLNGVTDNIQTQLNSKQQIVENVSSTELGYLVGVTGNIQTQLNSKQNIITGAASTIITDNLPPNVVLVSDSNNKVSTSSITSTELGYLVGVTGNIQTQLNSVKTNNIVLTQQNLVLGLIHVNGYISCRHTGQITITVPNQNFVNWPDGSVIYFRRDSNAGAITIVEGSGVIVNGKIFAPTVLENQNFALRRISQNVWDFI